ncbi:Uncharacterized [Syntrophomonas zehnderi OL-4]|uniref:Uncharacterized n=1 Tax=Syntrophomonas zehnderi OL-4 TaxID=690567 RepID=A0A0E4G9K4_9FIRM|nr:hypothetical protein [Syntrophomonas zehnderi]CFX16416.1 Uncharacterized [Syntrophomonas zehnderi OL-4]
MKRIGLFIFVCALLITCPTNAFAAGEPGIVTGTKNLLEAATTWLLILIPAGCATMIGWHAFVKQMNEGDPAQAAIHNRAMKNALIAGAIGVSAVGIVKAFLGFYGS